MFSCDPATLARDVKRFGEGLPRRPWAGGGYVPEDSQRGRRLWLCGEMIRRDVKRCLASLFVGCIASLVKSGAEEIVAFYGCCGILLLYSGLERLQKVISCRNNTNCILILSRGVTYDLFDCFSSGADTGGVAEFLPISSSGHLAIAQNLLGMSEAGSVPEFFDVLLHLGTLVAVFAAYWHEICDMVVELFRGHRRSGIGPRPRLCRRHGG